MTIRSPESVAYKKKVEYIARYYGIQKPITGRVSIHLQLFPQRPQDWRKRAEKDPLHWDDTVRSIDLDNARKVLYDALKNVVFEDDKMVWSDSGERMVPDGQARVVVTISRYERKGEST